MQNTNPVIENWGMWKLTLAPTIKPENLTIESPTKMTLPASLPGDPPSEAVMIPWTDDPTGSDVTVTLNDKIEPGIRTQTDQNHAKPDKVEPYLAQVDTIEWEVTGVTADTTSGTGAMANFRVTAPGLGKLTYTLTLKGRDGIAPVWPQAGQEAQATFTKEVELVPADIAVDANRDGEVNLGSSTDRTEESKPFRFWCNDDQDSTFGTTEGENFIEGERTPVAVPDSNNNQIVAKRDLEDFTRLWIHIGAFYQELQDANGKLQVGLKWKNTNGTSPAIKVYSSADLDGSTSYLTSDTAAGAQIAPVINATEGCGVSLGEVKESGTPFIFKNEFWTGYSVTNPKKCLIFEGSGEGKGQLCITILDAEGHEIGEGPGVWLDLKDIKKMYQSSLDDEFEQPPDEAKESIVFVHGWRMSPAGSRNFAETMFKRMWHRGYKGRFAYFRWNTDWSNGFQWLPLIGEAVDSYLANYNGSEQKAWLAAADLKEFVDNAVPYSSKNIAAHSMGNIVAGEALRLGMGITNYALMQAAVPAACYDEDEGRIRQTTQTIHTAGPLTFTMWDNETPDNDPDSATRALAYRGRLAGAPVNAANLISFFLPEDYATSFAWEINNDQSKPPNALFGPNYEYERNGVNAEKLFKFSSRHIPNPGAPPIYFGKTILSAPSDAYEAMPFACRTWGKAVGAWGPVDTSPGTQGSIDLSENLGLSAYQLQNQTKTGFGEDHSGQFTGRIQELKPFYDRLLDAFGLEANP